MGAQKSGTTALHRFLSEHPQICMADRKEVHFFNKKKYFRKSPPDYDRYHSYFSNPSVGQITGEATPRYMYCLSASKRIKEYNPEMKLIFILRNPVERAYSHYMMTRKKGKEPFSFSLAIRIEKIRLLLRINRKKNRLYSYADRGFYSKQIRRAMEYFPVEQMLFLRTEDLKLNHTDTLDKVCEFLGVKPLNHFMPKTVFSNKYSPMSSSCKRYLYKKFRDDINSLTKLIDQDFSDWRIDHE